MKTLMWVSVLGLLWLSGPSCSGSVGGRQDVPNGTLPGAGGAGQTPPAGEGGGNGAGGATADPADAGEPPEVDPPAVSDMPANDQEAARFLQQATMGYRLEEIANVRKLGFSAWIDAQFALPQHYSFVEGVRQQKGNDPDARTWAQNVLLPAFAFIHSDDQLRQRQMWSLSQIMVLGNPDGTGEYMGWSTASYHDALYQHSFGNFRELLEAVTLNPAMGNYLSHIYNLPDDPKTGRVPDQNFAREIMQLFSIGLWELNENGTQKLDAQGQPIPAYTQADIIGASRVMTGWAPKGATQWPGGATFDLDSQLSPMQSNDRYHSGREKKFLGVTIPEGSTDARKDLQIFLDRLANHSNTGPFIGKQLIQRMVTSNPTKGYVARVARAFANNGQGVRGDMKAVLKAVLLDYEARSEMAAQAETYGRIREPFLRFTQIARSFNARPHPETPFTFGAMTWDYDTRKGLWQSPLKAPSVFNYYQPGFSPSGSELATRGLVAPEMQITTIESIGDVYTLLGTVLLEGVYTTKDRDQRPRMYLDYAQPLKLAATPDALVDELNLRFMSSPMSAELRGLVKERLAGAGQGFPNSTGEPVTPEQRLLAQAMMLVFASPEYIVQK